MLANPPRDLVMPLGEPVDVVAQSFGREDIFHPIDSPGEILGHVAANDLDNWRCPGVGDVVRAIHSRIVRDLTSFPTVGVQGNRLFQTWKTKSSGVLGGATHSFSLSEAKPTDTATSVVSPGKAGGLSPAFSEG